LVGEVRDQWSVQREQAGIGVDVPRPRRCRLDGHRRGQDAGGKNVERRERQVGERQIDIASTINGSGTRAVDAVDGDREAAACERQLSHTVRGNVRRGASELHRDRTGIADVRARGEDRPRHRKCDDGTDQNDECQPTARATAPRKINQDRAPLPTRTPHVARGSPQRYVHILSPSTTERGRASQTLNLGSRSGKDADVD
jgi:hypothetical protein